MHDEKKQHLTSQKYCDVFVDIDYQSKNSLEKETWKFWFEPQQGQNKD
jgi:IS4 transposase